MDDPFDTSPQVPLPGGQHQHLTSAKGAGNTAKHTQVYRPQPHEQGLGKKKLNTVCCQFNWTPAGCLYGEDCIFAHWCPVQFQTQEKRGAACWNPIYKDLENS